MHADLAIVGAGTAGAALAFFAAKRGLRVVCLERRAAREAGARWVNGVPGWAFDAAGLDRPRDAEVFGAGHEMHLLAGFGPRRVTIRGHDVLELDMRALVERLQSLAREHGATLVENARVIGFDGRTLDTSAGRVTARWYADASGLAGARLLEQARVNASDLCAAAQEVRAVSDLAGARAFFERHQVDAGHTACFTGVAGGFSVINVRLAGDRVGILTGSIPGAGHPAGQAILDRFVADQKWIGARLFGGARAIPLRRPLDVLARGNVALIGDAACQVFSAHGSGIGAGMIAARLLADALAEGREPHDYAVAWHRQYGGLFATFDSFRRFSQSLGERDLDRMMAAGLLDEHSARAGLEQRLPRPTPGVVVGALRGVATERRLALRLVPALARGAAAAAHYARYPDDPRALGEWSARAARIMG
ncbi:MAG: NAD(P)-binding protein [Polyangiaceae bacterium]|nr:NAD(P)-binding protein [Polyangiaceae bacterium]